MHPAFDLPFKRYAERSRCRDDGGSQPGSRHLQQAPVSYSASGSATTQLKIWAILVATLQGFWSNHLTLTLTPRHDHLEEATVPRAVLALGPRAAGFLRREIVPYTLLHARFAKVRRPGLFCPSSFAFGHPMSL